MSIKKVLACTLATTAAFATMSFTSCGKDDALIVYTEAGFAPFEYVNGGKIVGVDVDIMNLVGESLGKKVKFKSVGFDTIIDAVADGKLCDVGAAGISVTEERKAKVDFSTEYYTANLYVIYPANQADKYVATMDDNVQGVFWGAMAEDVIAVQEGTTADLFLSDELEDGGALGNTNATPKRFDKLAFGVEDIGLNSDVLIIDELPAKKLIEGNTKLACAPLYYEGYTDEETNEYIPDEAAVDSYAICVQKGNTELLNAINAVLATLGKDGIQALVDKHLDL